MGNGPESQGHKIGGQNFVEHGAKQAPPDFAGDEHPSSRVDCCESGSLLRKAPSSEIQLGFFSRYGVSVAGIFPPDANKDGVTLNRLVAYLEKADARDKVVKAIQNYLKYLVWKFAGEGRKDVSKQMKALASVLSQYRSILKFGKPVKSVREIVDIGRPGDFGDIMEITTNCWDIVYKLGDNLEFLSAFKVLPFSPARMENVSKIGQFWTYFTQVVLDIIAWRKIARTTIAGSQERETKMQKLRLDLLKDVSDLLRVGPPYLRRYMKRCPTHEGFQSLMGAVAGASGAYAVWLKTK